MGTGRKAVDEAWCWRIDSIDKWFSHSDQILDYLLKIIGSYTVVHWYEQSIKTRKKKGENTNVAWDKKKKLYC